MQESRFALTDRDRHPLRRWLPWLDQVQSVRESLEYMLQCIEQQPAGDGPTFAIYHTKNLIGIVGFHPKDQQQESAALGYWLSQNYAGRGIVTAATATLLNLGFNDMQLSRIELHCHVDNSASRPIAEKLGVHLTELRTNSEWLYDHWADQAIYHLLKEDYAIEGDR
ncbi:MAG: GNAT family N-acetyltransferase [Cellvibrionaceae bacterium]|nr:GNAT family N-acetyltransferase [Cellvibrionaceae bacterium]